MNQEKFINAYIELLSATLTEALQKNLVLQTQKKLGDEEIAIFEKIITETNEALKSLSIKKDQEISSLKSELNDARKNIVISSNERDEFKKTTQHIDTFKTELLKSRAEIEKLNKVLIAKDTLIASMQAETDNLDTSNTQTSVKKVSKKKNTPLFDYEKKNTPLFDHELTQETIKDAGIF